MKVHKRLLLAGLAVLAALVPATGAAATPTADPADEPYVQFVNNHSGQCMVVPGGSTDAGTGLIQWYCANYADQYWKPEYQFTDQLGRSWYHLINENDGQCVAVPGGTTDAGTQVMQWPCGPYADHYWTFRSGPGDTFQVINYNSGQCLVIGGGGTNAGAPLTQWPCSTGPDTYWREG